MDTFDKITPINIEEEMKNSYIDYAMSVIVGRALPDVRDGFKPVHRRILYSMHENGMTPGKPYKKSARVVGEVLGKYHPHGDSAVYDSMVRMAQNFALRYPLVDGQGNFGSIDGDSAAAMRYTEARMSKIATEMLADIEKETVDTSPNFDESLQEPNVLPTKIPNLLINGTSGIAVGMATNIPPHNINEVVNGCIKLIDNPLADVFELMEDIKGPDFPTAAEICGRKGIMEAYSTGRGIIKVKAKCHIEEVKGKKGKIAIIVDEIPYQVNKAQLIIKIADLVKDKKIEDISDLRDESDKKGMRIYIELKKDANEQVVLNQLYKHTQMMTSFGINMVALVNGVPRQLTLKQMLEYFIEHREEVITRRTQFDLDKARARAHILEGLRIALANLDAVIKLIRESKDVESARTGLMDNFELSDKQANAILDMRLQKLTGLEREKIEEEYNELLIKIADLEDILAKRERKMAIIKEELTEIKEKYGDLRKTEIGAEIIDMDEEDLIAKETVAVFLTKQGFVKRVAIDTFRAQLRGGRGIAGMGTREDDIIDNVFVTSTHDYIMCFTSLGKVYWLKVYKIPEASRLGKGIHLSHLINLDEDEHVTAAINVSDYNTEDYFMMATIKGVVKKTRIDNFKNIRSNGVIAINLDEGDTLQWVKRSDGDSEVMMATAEGMIIRYHENDVRHMGRATRGVRGITLNVGDKVVSMDVLKDDHDIMILTESGIGKRTRLSEYRLQKRGGKGLRAIKLKSRPNQDYVTKIAVVEISDEIIIVTKNGTVSRQKVKAVSMQRRAARGVKVQKLDGGDYVVDFTKVYDAVGEDDTESELTMVAEADNEETPIFEEVDDSEYDDVAEEADEEGEEE